MDDAEFLRWYGPWAPPTPGEVASLFAGMPARWWIVGGWTIEAFTGVAREHEDLDVSILRGDLAVLLEHVGSTLCVWTNQGGTLRPLLSTSELPDDCRQLWVRRDGSSPWLFDLLLSPHEGSTWISVRSPDVRLPIASVVVERDGIPYQRPEITLLLKARLDREKDRADLATTLPLLAPARRAWLRRTLERVHPGHAWLSEI